MATIINNDASQPQSALRIDNPYMYIFYPDKSKAVDSGYLYFGEPSLDPENAANQKRVYVIQEDGSVITIDQPVRTGGGGTPLYNGSPVKLAIDGSYSFKALDKNRDLLYYSAKTTHPTLASIGTTEIIEDVIELSSGQSSVTFPRADLSMSTVDITGALIDSRDLYRDEDYTISNGSTGTIFLTSTFPAGTKIRARQNAFTDQDEETIREFRSFSIIADALNADMSVGTEVFIAGNTFYYDGLAFDKYIVTWPGTGTNDGVNYINMANGNQLQSLQTRAKFLTYTENVATAALSSGTLTIDMNAGTVHEVELTESVSTITILNVQPDVASSFTLNMTQDATGGRIVSLSGFLTPGGTTPTITTTAGTQSKLGFTTLDGVTWEVYLIADDLQAIP